MSFSQHILLQRIRSVKSLGSSNPRNRSKSKSPSCVVDKVFKMQKPIGKGAFGEVFSAYWTVKNKNVALKKVEIKQKKGKIGSLYNSLRLGRRKRGKNQSPKRFFSGEVENWGKLADEATEDSVPAEKRSKSEMEREIKHWKKIGDHFGIISLLDSFYVDSQCWLVMELCSEGNLFLFVQEFTNKHMLPFTMDLCLEIITPIVSAVTHLNSIGIIHRDIKPENILLTDKLMPKLGDFGLCADFDTKKGHLKSDHAFSGTPSYAPPEAFFGEKIYPSWDSFSIFCTLMYAKFGKSCWDLGKKKKSDEEIAEFCIKFAQDPEEVAEKELLNEIHVLPKSEYIKKRSQDDFDWTPERLEFGEFAAQCLRWNPEKRLLCSELQYLELFKDRVASWEEFPEKAAENLKEKIQSWIDDDTFIDDKWLVF